MTTIDTSVAVAAFAPWQEHHSIALDAVAERVRLIGHVALETYSVLTRLPTPHRAPPELVFEFLIQNFPAPWLVLSARDHRRLVSTVASSKITGGAVYDALIGATALAAGETLLTLDRRAIATYEMLGTDARFLRSRRGRRLP